MKRALYGLVIVAILAPGDPTPAQEAAADDPYAGLAVYAGETHVHPASAWSVYRIGQPEYDHTACKDGMELVYGRQPHSNVWCDRVYARGRSLGLDWVVETHHSSGLIGLPPDPIASRVLAFWRDPKRQGFADPLFGSNPDYRYPTHPNGFPDWKGGFTLSEWQSHVACADASDEPGRFAAFAGIEWTVPGPGQGCAPGDAACGGHKTVLFADPPREVCAPDPMLGLLYCPSETALYEQVRRHGGVVNLAHPWKRGVFGSALIRHNALTAPGGIDGSVVLGAEVSPERSSEEDLERGFRTLIRQGFKLHPVFGGDCHNRPDTSCANHCGPGWDRVAPRTVCWSRALDRPSLIEAMRAHRCYWTSSGKPEVRFGVEGRPMGSTLRAKDVDPARGLRVVVDVRRKDGGRLGSWDLIRDGKLVMELSNQRCEPDRCQWSGPVAGVIHSLYLRVNDGSGERDRRILSAPVWIEP